jgi:hypothetical protein
MIFPKIRVPRLGPSSMLVKIGLAANMTGVPLLENNPWRTSPALEIGEVSSNSFI